MERLRDTWNQKSFKRTTGVLGSVCKDRGGKPGIVPKGQNGEETGWAESRKGRPHKIEASKISTQESMETWVPICDAKAPDTH